MALIEGSKPDIVSAFNRQADVPLDYAGLIFSRMQVDETDPLLVRIRITAQDSYQYRGTQVVTYHRLSLETLPGLLYSPPRLTPQPTLYELLPALRDALGIRLDVADVEDAPVEDLVGTYQVRLVAKADSYGWVGACDLVFQDLPPLSIPINYTDIRW